MRWFVAISGLVIAVGLFSALTARPAPMGPLSVKKSDVVSYSEAFGEVVLRCSNCKGVRTNPSFYADDYCRKCNGHGTITVMLGDRRLKILPD